METKKTLAQRIEARFKERTATVLVAAIPAFDKELALFTTRLLKAFRLQRRSVFLKSMYLHCVKDKIEVGMMQTALFMTVFEFKNEIRNENECQTDQKRAAIKTVTTT